MNIKLRAREIRQDNSIEYQHRTVVHYLPGIHAVNNARYSAQLLEEHREERRKEMLADLMRQQRDNLVERERIEQALEALRSQEVGRG